MKIINEKLLNYALESLLVKKISVIPVGKNKIPLIGWKEFQQRFATEEEVRGWFERFDDPQIGFVTGKISNLLVIDIEKGGDPSFLPQETMIIGTGGGGYHYYFKFEEGIMNKARIRPLTDWRGEGGYVVSPYSITEKGPYSILQHAEWLSFPKELFPAVIDTFSLPSKTPPTYNKTIKEYPGYGTGQRNDEMARYIGHILTRIHPSDWDSQGWQIVQLANQRNIPPLASNELKATFESLKRTEKRNNPFGRSQGHRSASGSSLEDTSDAEFNQIIDDNDEIKHIADVAAEQKLDSSDIYPLQMPCFDNVINGGVSPGDLIVVAGQSGHGKRLHIDTPILTPDGWKKNKDICVGEKIIGKDGKPTLVTGAHPVNKGKSYKIEFNDNTSVIADGDHLWTVQSSKQRQNSKKWMTLTTKEILSKGIIFNNVKNCKTTYKWFLPIVDPIIFAKKKLLIKPYTLGTLLANGSFSSSMVNIVTDDEEIVQRVISESREIDISEYVCKNQTTRRWIFKKYHPILKEKNLDYVLSSDKFIPEEYLFSSIEDRKKLLAGLIDSDGYVRKNSRAVYFSVSKKMAEGVATLVRSLGGIASIRMENRKKGKNGYVVQFWTPFNPFLLKRKNKNYSPNPWFKAIKKIEPSKECEMRCLSVENRDGLYVIEDFTITHNTSLVQDWTISLLRGEKKPKSLWFSYEVLPTHLWKKFQEMGMTKEDCAFIPCKHTSGNVAWVEQKIKEGKEKFGIKMVMIDHLGFLLPKTEGVLGKSMASNYAMFLTQVVRDLKTIALREEVIIFLPVHMKKVDSRNKQSDINDIKDSSGIGQESDLVFLIEREKDKGNDAKSYFTNITKITLAKNRKTGATVIGNFTMINGRFAYDETNDKIDAAFDDFGKEKTETKPLPPPPVVTQYSDDDDMSEAILNF